MHTQPASEVRRVLAQIESEYQAAQAAHTGYAITAKHAFITARMENIGKLHESLKQIVGADATRLLAECLEAAGK